MQKMPKNTQAAGNDAQNLTIPALSPTTTMSLRQSVSNNVFIDIIIA